MPKTLGEFEQLILMAILRLGDDAYGVTIRREIEERTGRDVSAGAVYTALGRLEKGGLVSSRIGEPTPERGGRRKKFYRLEPVGARALHGAYETLRQMAEGIEEDLEALPELPGMEPGPAEQR